VADAFNDPISLEALRRKGLADTDRRGVLKGALAAGFSVAALGTILASGTALRPAHAQGAPSGRLIFANAEPPTSNYWDPAAGFGLVDEQVASLVHDTLIAFDQDGVLQPSLATAWQRTSPTTLEATLRTDAVFHDGTPVTAEDVKASYDRLGQGELAQSMVVQPGISVTIKDASTIEIATAEPFGPLENAMAFVKILKADDIANPDNWKERAMGSGPYRFVSYAEGDVTLEANPDYWGEPAKIETVIFRYIEDGQARINALLSGQVDIMTRVSTEDLGRVEGNDEFAVHDVSPPAQIIAILQHNGQLADVRLRQAIAHAVDRQAIAESIMQGVNPVAFSSLPTTMPLYQPLEPEFAYDPERAKELLAEAGFADGVALTMATTTLVPNQLQIDQAIAAYLQQVGMTVALERLEVGAFRSSYNTYDVSLNTLASFNNDADFILGLYTGAAGAAIWHFEDEAYNALHAAQRSAVGDARPAAVTDAARYLWANQATLYLSDEVWYTIVNRRVQDYRRAPLVGENLVPQASIA
jgi:peptide/nickel transport system substrate-binding protein